MKTITREGKSTSKVISDFMQENNLVLDDFKFEVIEEGSSGILNLFGKKPSVIKFSVPDVGDYLTDFTEKILQNMNIHFEKVEVSKKNDSYTISVNKPDDAGFVIGKSAKLLNSLQYLINQMINKKMKQQLRIKLDVDGYREKRKDALLNKVKSVSKKVKQQGKSVTLEPLHAAHRHLVHKFVENDKQIRTMTLGDGEYKRIVIMPNKNLSKKPKKYIPKKHFKKKTNNISQASGS